jgi:hypothetical protein
MRKMFLWWQHFHFNLLKSVLEIFSLSAEKAFHIQTQGEDNAFFLIIKNNFPQEFMFISLGQAFYQKNTGMLFKACFVWHIGTREQVYSLTLLCSGTHDLCENIFSLFQDLKRQ